MGLPARPLVPMLAITRANKVLKGESLNILVRPLVPILAITRANKFPKADRLK